jgi:hypothetical protein
MSEVVEEILHLRAEVRRLRSLLVRYADHVGECEGIDFLSYPGGPLTDAEKEEVSAMLARCDAGKEP